MNTQTAEIIPTQQYLEQVEKLMASTLTSFIEAARIIALGVDGDRHFKKTLIERNPKWSMITLNRLEMVGRGQISPRMLEGGILSPERFRSLPLSDQEAAINDGVLVWEGNDKVRMVTLASMGPKTVRQCFANGYIRTPDQQAAWHTEQVARAKSRARMMTLPNGDDMGYEIAEDRRSIVIKYPPCKLTKKLLRALLAEMGNK